MNITSCVVMSRKGLNERTFGPDDIARGNNEGSPPGISIDPEGGHILQTHGRASGSKSVGRKKL